MHLLVGALRLLAFAVHFSHALLELIPEQGEHRLLDFVLDLRVLEKGHGREYLGESLQTGSEHYDDFSDVYFRLLPQVKQDQHQIDFVLYQLRVMLQVTGAGLAKVREQDERREELQ